MRRRFIIEICNGKINEDDPQLKLEHPLKYYLENIGNIKVMNELRQENLELYNKIQRISYIKSFQTREKLYLCPECHTSIVEDEWGEQYCPSCGLVTRSHYDYVAGLKFKLPYGLKI